MKSKSAFRLVRTGSPAASILAAAISTLLAAQSAQATTLYWDPNTTTAAFGTGGTWGTDAFWTADSTGAFITAPTDVLTTTSADNVIVNKGIVTPYTMAVAGDVHANSLTYASNAGSTANPGTVTDGGSGVIHLYASGLGNPFFPDAGGIDIRTSISVPIVLEAAGGTSVYIGNYPGGGNNASTTFSSLTSTNSVDLYVASRGAYNITSLSNLKGTIHNEKANGTLTLGTIGSGVTGVVQKGAGAMTLSSAASTYTGKTSVQVATLNYSVPLSNTGAAGPLGAPTGDDATIDLYPGTTFQYNGVQGSPTGGTGNPSVIWSSTDRTINLAGSGSGIVALNGQNINDTTFRFDGPFTATGTGSRTLQITSRGDRPLYIYSGGIPDMSDASPVTVSLVWSSQSSSSNGRIELNGSHTFSGPLNLTGGGNGGPGTLLIGGTGVLGSGSYANKITFTSGTVASVVLNYASSANQTLSGMISGPGALTKSGSGSLTLTYANTFSGATTVSAGQTLTLNNNLALQNSALATSAGAITLSGDITTLAFGGLTGSTALASVIAASGYNAITALTLNPQAGVTAAYSGAIVNGTGDMPVTKTGAGVQILSGTNLYTGTTTISAGVVQANDGTGMPSGSFLSLDGGILQSTSASTFSRPLGSSGSTFQFTANGGGFSATGGQLTVNIGGASAEQTWGSTVGTNLVGTLHLGSTSATASTLFQNPIDLNAATRTISVGANTSEISGVIRTSSGTAGLTKIGAGTLILSGANTYDGPTTLNGGALLLASGTYSGGITINAGTLTLAGNVTLPPSSPISPITLLTGQALVLDNTSTNNDNRVANGQAFILAGGSLIYKGSTTTHSTETMDGLSAALGSGPITITYGGTNTATLTAASFIHSTGNGSTLVNGTGLGMDTASSASVGRLLLTSAPTLVGTSDALDTGNAGASANKNTKLVPFLVGESGSTSVTGVGTQTGTANTFLTYHATTGLRPLNPIDEFTNDAIATGNNIRIAGADVTASTGGTVNSLIIARTSATALTITDGQTLTNTSGALLFANNATIKPSATTGSLAFDAAEAMVTVNSGITGIISAPITGTGGLTKSGAGILTLSGVNTSLTGGVTLNSGSLNINNANAIGTNTFTISGGTVGSSGVTLPNNLININGSFTYGIANSALNLGTGAVTLGGNYTITVAQNTLTISGKISDGGNGYGLTKAGTNSLTLTNATNDYTGKTSVLAGTLNYSAPLSNVGVAGPLGAPTDDNAIIDLYPGTTFQYNGVQGSPTGGTGAPAVVWSSTDRTINLAGSGSGTVALNGQNINDTTFRFNGAFTATGTGPRTLQITSRGDRPLYIYNGGIPDMSDTSPVTVSLIWSSQSSSSNGRIELNGTHTFSGPLNLTGGGNGGPGTVLIGGTGVLGNGSYANNITFTAGTVASVVLNYGSSASQTLSGVISGPGALTLSGPATLTLSGANTYSGITTVSQGMLLVNGTNSGAGAVNVSANATLGGTGSISGNTTLAANGRLSFNLSTAATSHDQFDITGTLVFSGASVLDITASGALPSPGTYTLVTAAGGITGSAPTTLNLPPDWAATVSISGDSKSLLLNVSSTGSANPYADWALAMGLDGTAGKESGSNADPDKDGRSNLDEFAFDGNPLKGASEGKVVGKVATLLGGDKVMTLTLPVRRGASFSGTTAQVSALIDGLVYTIQGSDTLDTTSWTLGVTEITGADAASIQAGLPGLSDINSDTITDWTYRTFRSPGTVTDGDPRDFLRAMVVGQ